MMLGSSLRKLNLISNSARLYWTI